MKFTLENHSWRCNSCHVHYSSSLKMGKYRCTEDDYDICIRCRDFGEISAMAKCKNCDP